MKTTLLSNDGIHRQNGGNAAVLELKAGDAVTVISTGTSYLVGGSHDIFCTFSGHLLAASGPSIIVGK